MRPWDVTRTGSAVCNETAALTNSVHGVPPLTDPARGVRPNGDDDEIVGQMTSGELRCARYHAVNGLLDTLAFRSGELLKNPLLTEQLVAVPSLGKSIGVEN